ncbi:MAG: DUF2634 domain-containing protein [Eubacterium sp.]|nr:DUF2634 domain-containing protein [Eubacterium sp.]
MPDFPFIPDTLTVDTAENLEQMKSAVELPLFKEYAIDWDNNTLLLKDGRPYLITGNEALKIWIYKALHPQTQIFKYNAYSNNYGNEFMNLISRFVNTDIKRAELQRIITEALLVNPYILNLSDFVFSQTGSKMTIEFTVQTVYGKIDYTQTQGVE